MGTDYLDYWFFGFLCCTNHRDDLFLGVQTSCIFDIHVVKVCETRFLHLPIFSICKTSPSACSPF